MFVISKNLLYRGSIPYILLYLWQGRRTSFVISRTALNRGLFNSRLHCIQFELFVIGYPLLDTHVICTTIAGALMDFFAMFPSVFKT